MISGFTMNAIVSVTSVAFKEHFSVGWGLGWRVGGAGGANLNLMIVCVCVCVCVCVYVYVGGADLHGPARDPDGRRLVCTAAFSQLLPRLPDDHHGCHHSNGFFFLNCRSPRDSRGEFLVFFSSFWIFCFVFISLDIVFVLFSSFCIVRRVWSTPA